MPTALPPVPQADWDAHQEDSYTDLTKDQSSRIDALAQTEQAVAQHPVEMDAAREQDYQAQQQATAARVEALRQDEQAQTAAHEQDYQQRQAEQQASIDRLRAAETTAAAAPEQDWRQAQADQAARIERLRQTEQGTDAGATSYPGEQGAVPPAGDFLSRVGRIARASGHDEEGARVAQAVARTEGALDSGRTGDQTIGGSYGPYQFYRKGQLPAFAAAKGMSVDEAAQYAAANPDEAAQWALSGYLGAAIKEGQARGLRGAALATYAQQHGQVSESPERAGASYDALFGAGDTALGTDAATASLMKTGPQTSPGERRRVEAIGQFEQEGVPYEEAAADCGPVAALAFVQANGRNPSMAEVRALKRRFGWTPEGGMNGLANEQRLLTELKTPSKLDPNPDFGHIAQDAQNGNPVIVSTAKHYYFVNGYDKNTGQLRVMKTGTSRRGGGSWMSAQQIATLDGGINGALFVDNPGSPAPSVGAADTSGDRPPSEFEQPTQPDLSEPPLNDQEPAAAELVARYRQAQQDALPETDAITPENPLPPANTLLRTPFGPAALPMELPINPAKPVRPTDEMTRHLAEGKLTSEDITGGGAAMLAKMTTGEEPLDFSNPRAAVGSIVKVVRAAMDTGQVGRFVGKQGEALPGNVGQMFDNPELVEQRARLGEEIGGTGSVAGRGFGGEAVGAVARSEAGGLGGGGSGSNIVARSAGAGVPAARAGEVERLRLDKFPAAVRDTVEEAATNGDFWVRQRRGVIPDAESERMADALKRSVDTMIAGGGLGRSYNAEETRALRNAVTGQAMIVDDLRTAVEAAGGAAPPALHAQLARAEQQLSGLSRIVEGARAEAGRTFRAYLMDTRGRVTGAREDPTAWYRLPRDPGRAAPELGPGVAQARQFESTEFTRPPTETGPTAAPLEPEVRQAEQFGSTEFMRPPTDVQAQPRQPGSKTPVVTEQKPLTLEMPAGDKPSLYDRVSLVRMAGMLSGVPTHLLNIAGNVLMGGATLAMKEGQVGADLARVGIGKALGKDVARQRFQAEMGPQMAGYARGLWAGVQQAPGILRTGVTEAQRAALDAPRGLRSGSAVVDAAVEMPLRALAASDAIFRGAAFGGHSAALAVRQATQEGLSGAARAARVEDILGNISSHPRLLEEANNLAARDVFQESRGATEAIARFKREHAAARAVGDVVLPFYKTPYNVAAQGAGMTPAGYASVISAARRGETGEAIDRAVRATAGTAALGVGLSMAASGTLTGPYPATAQERSTLPEGWKPYAIRVPTGDGAVYVPIQALGAFAVPLGVAANMQDAVQRGADAGDVMKGVYAGLGGLGKFMMDMSAFQGLNAVSKLVTEPEKTVEAFSESLASSFVPDSAMMRQVQQALGDAQRDPHGPHEAFLAAIPGLSRFVPEKKTALGDTRQRGVSGPMALVSGSRIGVEVPDATLAALRSAKVNIPDPPKSVGVSNVPLTPAEQQRYQEIAGGLIRSSVAGIAGASGFEGRPLAVRQKTLQNAVERDRAAAEARIIKEIGSAEMTRRVRETVAARR